MKKRKIGFCSGLFGLLALCLTVGGIFLALLNRNAGPVLVRQPEAARNQVQTMLDALCAGEYDTVSSCLYGTPDLGMGGEAADPVGQLFCKDLVEHIVLVEGDGIVDAALGIGLRGDHRAFPILGKYLHSMLPAEGE